MRNIQTDRTILALEFSPDGGFLASGGWKHVGLWDVATDEFTEIEQDDCLLVTSLAFSNDASHLLWICQAPANAARLEIRSAILAKRRQTASKFLPESCDAELAMLPDGRALTVVHEQCACWQVDTLETRVDRKLQAVGGAVSIWNSPFGRMPTCCPGKGRARTAFDPLPEGTLLARTERGSLEVRPVGKRKAIFSQNQPRVHAIAFTPDGRRMIACEERSVCTWDTSRWQRLEQFDWDIGSPQCVAVSPDGLTAAASGYAGNIVIWDIDA